MESLDVDEVIAQLLASEGFASVEEIAYVEPHEIASIEGFDEDTAVEIQNRALEFLERRETELDNKRRELGVEDDLASVEGLSKAMLVALGENGVKTLEDLADCATDDLVGWSEKKDGATTRYEGFLQPFDLTREEAEQLILNARIQAGWIEPEPEPEVEAEPEAEEAGEDADDEGEAELGGEQPAR
jgi:N utilization substance protein A